MPSPPEDTASDIAEVQARSRELIDRAELVDVRPIAMEVVVHDQRRSAPVASVAYDFDSLYSAAPGEYANRFDYAFSLLSDTKEPVADVRFSLLVEYRIDGDFEASPDVAQFVSDTTGYFAAYPYARELLESISTRLHLDPLVLGLLQRGAVKPRSIGSIQLRPEVQ